MCYLETKIVDLKALYFVASLALGITSLPQILLAFTLRDFSGKEVMHNAHLKYFGRCDMTVLTWIHDWISDIYQRSNTGLPK